MLVTRNRRSSSPRRWSTRPAAGAELLPDQEELTRFLDADRWTGRRDGTPEELTAVRALRPRLRKFWEAAGVDDAVEVVNTLLLESGARPRLTRHDDLGWHLHVTADDSPLVDRMAAEAAMGVLDLIRTDEFSRLRWCEAPGLRSGLRGFVAQSFEAILRHRELWEQGARRRLSCP